MPETTASPAPARDSGTLPAASALPPPLAGPPALVMLGHDDVGQCVDGVCALPTSS